MKSEKINQMIDVNEATKTLYIVSELLPTNKTLEDEVISLIREKTKIYIANKNKSISNEVIKYEEGDFVESMNVLFEPLVNLNFKEFPLSISEQTLRNFITGETHYRKEKDGINPSSKSIRSIAAFLILDKSSDVKEDDIIYKRLHSKTAYSLASFLQNEYEDGDLTISNLEGFYSENTDKKKTHVEIGKSYDESHFFVQLTLENRINNEENNKKYGWGIITSGNIILILIKTSEFNYFYVSEKISINHNGDFLPHIIEFSIYKRPIEISLSKNNVKKTIPKLIVKKDNEELIKDKPFSDNIKIKNLHLLKISNPRLYKEKKHEKKGIEFMEDTVKEQLSYELFCQFIDTDETDHDEVFSLLSQGASINYQKPSTGNTVIHLIAGFSVKYVKSILDASHEEYNHLLRNKEGHLASMGAMIWKDRCGTFNFLRNRELEAGRKAGLYAGLLAHRKLNDDGSVPSFEDDSNIIHNIEPL